jgi:N-acetylglucosamine repressor
MKKRVATSKLKNKKVVLELIRSDGPLPVSQIAKKARLSIPTVHKIAKEFVQKGFVVPAGKGLSTEDGGKKPVFFGFNCRYAYALAVYIGADSITVAITDACANILHSEEIAMKKDGPIETVVDIVAERLKAFQSLPLVKHLPLMGVAVGIPGLVDPTRGISHFSLHYRCWKTDYPFKLELQRKADLRVPVYVDNVNRFQALAERDKGAAKNKRDFVIVDALPEGLGAGFVSNGEIKHGARNLSGEIGHMILQRGGAQCICGARGCFEAMVSEKRVLGNVCAGYASHPESLVFEGRAPESVRISHVFEAFHRSDAFAKEIIDDIIEWFAVGLVNVIMTSDPELIILQGIYNDLGDYFLDRLREALRKGMRPWMRQEVGIQYSMLGPSRGVVGAAAYLCDRHFEIDIWN